MLQGNLQFTGGLEGTARYAGFTSSSCGGLRPPAEAFFALWGCFGLLSAIFGVQ